MADTKFETLINPTDQSQEGEFCSESVLSEVRLFSYKLYGIRRI